jgi:dTDP-4-amino-4,6-dideoxygalactose transaminase
MKVTIPQPARERIVKSIGRILEKGWLMWGDQQEGLVDRFRHATGKAHGVTFNSATSAFDVLFQYLAREGEVFGFQATGFPSPVFSALRAGGRIEWLDINPDLMVPNTTDVEQAIQRGMTVYVPQWTGGFIPWNVEDQVKRCRDAGVIVVEDASHASGSGRPSKFRAGANGDHAIFSLAATKPLHTGQGGMLLTDDPDLAEFAFQMKNYGRDAMFQKGQYQHAGHNLHMTELQAAVGLVLFDYMDDMVQERRSIAMQLKRETGLKFLGDWSLYPNFYKVAVRIPANYPSREAFAAHLAEHGVEMGSAMYDFVTPTLSPIVAAGAGVDARVGFAGAWDHVTNHACIPCHNSMSQDDVETVIKACSF